MLNYFTDITLVLETVPEESSSSRPSTPDSSATPPPYNYSFHHEDLPENVETIPTYDFKSTSNSVSSDVTVIRRGESLPPNLVKMANIFHTKQEKGTIDVWWLYDDGGKIYALNV